MDMKINQKFFSYCLGLLFIWLLSYYSALSNMVQVWYQSNTYTHGFFIVPIVFYLLWQKRHGLDYRLQKSEWFWLLPLILIQGAFIVFTLLGINLLTQLCAYLTLLLGITSLFGWRFVIQIAFPLGYLIFAIPFGEEFVPGLQNITAQLSVFFLNLINIPVYQEGLYLYIPNGTFEVAEACAGIRFLIASVALGCLYAYLNYQKMWKRTLFVLIACTLPILANGIRAFGIIVIGHYSDMKYATGADHLIYGWFFFAFIILLLFWIGQIGRDPEPEYKTSSKHKTGSLNVSPYLVSLIAITLVATAGYLNYLKKSDSIQKANLQTQISQIFPGFELSNELTWQPIFTDAHAQAQGKLESNSVYVAQYTHDNSSHELVSGLHRHFDIERWTLFDSHQVKLNNKSYTELTLVTVQGHKIKVRYWYQVKQQQSSDKLRTKIAQLKSKLLHQHGAGYFIAVQISKDFDEQNWPALMHRFKQLDINYETE